jgi:ABC-type uncharacterized transport system ATPase subunit
VLLSSHRVEEIEELQSNVLVLDRGRNVYRGDLRRVRMRDHEPSVVVSFADARSAMAGLARFDRAGMDAGRLEADRETSLRVHTDVPLHEVFKIVDGDPSVTGIARYRPTLVEMLEQMWTDDSPRSEP